MIKTTLDDLLAKYRKAVERQSFADNEVERVKTELRAWIVELEDSSDRDIQAIAAEVSGSVAKLNG